ncbi:hypothetical protein K443DRAFT_684506 [Laccaria amethystina LaAM-08-1]|uniref:Uncharacterized protein n=1 Tax=Laccaria amethystina LaAM-08-1 TaxID=1095629 RepID=A0A0C9WQP3_9AGAR|nr:hypothetical protein K443DRAFT_684506 [Laccaria amethystina LaAM-08-1]
MPSKSGLLFKLFDGRIFLSLKTVDPYFERQRALLLDFAPERSLRPTGADLRAAFLSEPAGKYLAGTGRKSWLRSASWR